jgi:hypothetical protein
MKANSVEPIKKDIKFAVAYKVAILLLLELEVLRKEEEKNLVKSSLLTKFLAYLPLQPKHRVVCIRMAINKNLASQNYGVAARLIEVIFCNFTNHQHNS